MNRSMRRTITALTTTVLIMIPMMVLAGGGHEYNPCPEYQAQTGPYNDPPECDTTTTTEATTTTTAPTTTTTAPTTTTTLIPTFTPGIACLEGMIVVSVEFGDPFTSVDLYYGDPDATVEGTFSASGSMPVGLSEPDEFGRSKYTLVGEAPEFVQAQIVYAPDDCVVEASSTTSTTSTTIATTVTTDPGASTLPFTGPEESNLDDFGGLALSVGGALVLAMYLTKHEDEVEEIS